MQAKIVLASVALLVVGVLLTAGQAGCQATEQSQQKLPKLFDFDFYKERFGKTYGSLLENLDRKRLFFSRAFQAFVSGTKYKLRLQSHYNALNDMSDWSQEERDSMINKRLMEAGENTRASEPDQDDEDDEESFEDANEEFIPEEQENYEQELAQMIKEHGDEPGFKELKAELEGGKRRAKRNLAPREFSFDKLIASNETDDWPTAKFLAQVPSNNPDYEPIELASFGFRNTEKVTWNTVKRKDSRTFLEQAQEFIGSLFENVFLSRDEEPAEELNEDEIEDDHVYKDLRQNGCGSPVRDQYQCGSCWAFAAIALMEWVHCNQTGTRALFSAQYLMDCGSVAHKNIDGCEGATSILGIAWFMSNFGLELSKNYPYRALDGVCPYDKDADVKTMGYIRGPINDVASVHVSWWAEALNYGPLIIEFACGADFQDYGGGVYEGKGCPRTTNHLMVLMGHGIEDGKEYWLIRNSYGKDWGEQGYMKISKRTKRCLGQFGYALGSKDGINYDINFEMPNNTLPDKPWQQKKPKHWALKAIGL